MYIDEKILYEWMNPLAWVIESNVEKHVNSKNKVLVDGKVHIWNMNKQWSFSLRAELLQWFNIARGFFVEWWYFVSVVFDGKAKKCYRTHLVSAGVICTNEIRRPTHTDKHTRASERAQMPVMVCTAAVFRWQ